MHVCVRVYVCSLPCITFLVWTAVTAGGDTRCEGPPHASWGQVRAPRGCALLLPRRAERQGGRPPALLGNGLGLIGAWLVSHVSTYGRRRRIPLQAWAFPLHQRNHRAGTSASRPRCDSMAERRGLAHFSSQWTQVEHCAFRSRVVCHVDSSLQVHFVPGISFLTYCSRRHTLRHDKWNPSPSQLNNPTYTYSTHCLCMRMCIIALQ